MTDFKEATGGTVSDPDAPNLTKFKGALVLVTPKEYREGVVTTFKPNGTDAVLVDFVVLDGPDAGEQVENSLVFQGRLIASLKHEIGENVLGRVGQQPSKLGNPAWTLEKPTAADVAIARAL